MRWILPWLWQLSQRSVASGKPMEWEMELPEGDSLRLRAVEFHGTWQIDFAGSSRRLQRWLGQHRDELTSRLERLIGKPVNLRLDRSEALSPLS